MAWDLTRKQLNLALLALYLLHLTILGLYVFDIIPQQFHTPARPFQMHHGGDNEAYFNLARDLLTGTPQPSIYTLGFPLLLTPFLVIFRPQDQQEILQVVAAFWGIAMYPLGQWALTWLAERLTGSRVLALLSTFLWTMLPLVFYGIFGTFSLIYGQESFALLAETTSVRQTWAQMLSDGPATLFTLLLIVVFFRQLEGEDRVWWAIKMGTLAGFLMMIRYTGVLTGLLIGVILLAQRRWSVAAVVAVSAFVVFLPQILYNWRFFGDPLTTGYQVLYTSPPDGFFSTLYLSGGLAKVWTRVGLWLLPAILLSIGVGGFGLVCLWRHDRIGALVVGLWIGSYAVVYGLYFASWNGELLRFLMPIYPAIAVLAAAAAMEVLSLRQRRTRAINPHL